MGIASPITIIEIMGRDAGWLAASAAIAKQEERDAPHFIGVPEILVDEDRFLERMEEAYRQYGFAVAVIAENTRGPEGIIGGQAEPWYTDDFGHAYYDGRLWREPWAIRCLESIRRSHGPAAAGITSPNG